MIYDFAIIGAGMAGASLAAELAPHASVLVFEAESLAGYHATGRSAAFWSECYGGAQVQPLTTASGPWLEAQGFLKPRGALHVGRQEDRPALRDFEAEFSGAKVRLDRLQGRELDARLPGCRAPWSDAVWEPGCADIDVAALHQYYLSAARRTGAILMTSSPATFICYNNSVWTINSDENWSAKILINAAGAWADQVAQSAGVTPLGIQPMRRTMAQIRVATPVPDDLPLVIDIGGSFYFKPDHGRVWLSPHDETPSLPCDAAAEELDIALAIDRFEKIVDWPVVAVERAWAGLRSFAPDRLPVYGPDQREPGFFWFAGQGGFGIQTAPAAARLAAAMLLGNQPDATISQIDAARYTPHRFAQS
jgi:D-arginine dehydrogenase